MGITSLQRLDRDGGVRVDADARRRSPSTPAAISRASRSVWRASAFAAASAYAPPDPIAMIPSSGSIRSPVPESRNVTRVSMTISIASSRRSRRSVRQSFASSTADRSRLPRYCSSLDFEAGEQRERVGRRAGESGEDPIVVELPDLPGGLLDDRVAERDLAIAGHDGLAAMPDCKHCRRVEDPRRGHFSRVYRTCRSVRRPAAWRPGRGVSAKSGGSCPAKETADPPK